MNIHLSKINPEANQRRYYRLSIEPGFFGDWGLVREWGRIGRSGRLRTDWYPTEADAKEACFELHMKKAKRGYE